MIALPHIDTLPSVQPLADIGTQTGVVGALYSPGLFDPQQATATQSPAYAPILLLDSQLQWTKALETQPGQTFQVGPRSRADTQLGGHHNELVQVALKRIYGDAVYAGSPVNDTPRPQSPRRSLDSGSRADAKVARRHTAPELERTPSLISPSPWHGRERGRGAGALLLEEVTPVLPRHRSLDALVWTRLGYEGHMVDG